MTVQPDVLITRPAASLERKVVGGGIAGALTILALAALQHFAPEEAADLEPVVEILITYLVTVGAAYMTKSRMPVPVTKREPVE